MYGSAFTWAGRELERRVRWGCSAPPGLSHIPPDLCGGRAEPPHPPFKAPAFSLGPALGPSALMAVGRAFFSSVIAFQVKHLRLERFCM